MLAISIHGRDPGDVEKTKMLLFFFFLKAEQTQGIEQSASALFSNT